ncbi:phosphoribosyltransferase [Actinomadura sp. SCN-SB]|uniref:phosphoribosyltransferase n=1 Tax=Actinomadura sp. SCN-SB TaxID=3373092 RepID=UPI0037516893
MSRVFQHTRVWRLGPAQFDHAIGLVADAMARHDPQLIIGIERGGREPALAIAARLNTPARMLRASHNPNDAIGLPATGRVILDLQQITRTRPADRVLIVDDICGSGSTLHTTIQAITDLWAAACIQTATLCRNVGASFTPDAWIWDVADWVAFPWENTPHDAATEPLPAPTTVRSP